MEERNKVTSIFKSNDPEKLVVFHAASLQNERFYWRIVFEQNNRQHFNIFNCYERYIFHN